MTGYLAASGYLAGTGYFATTTVGIASGGFEVLLTVYTLTAGGATTVLATDFVATGAMLIVFFGIGAIDFFSGKIDLAYSSYSVGVDVATIAGGTSSVKPASIITGLLAMTFLAKGSGRVSCSTREGLFIILDFFNIVFFSEIGYVVWNDQ